MAENYAKYFKCKHCGHREFEEVMSDVVLISKVVSVWCDRHEEALLAYSGTDGADEGTIERYQCYECGTFLRDSEDRLVLERDELLSFLKEEKDARTREEEEQKGRQE